MDHAYLEKKPMISIKNRNLSNKKKPFTVEVAQKSANNPYDQAGPDIGRYFEGESADFKQPKDLIDGLIKG